MYEKCTDEHYILSKKYLVLENKFLMKKGV